MDDRRCTPTATHSFQLPIIQPHTPFPSLQPDHLPLYPFYPATSFNGAENWPTPSSSHPVWMHALRIPTCQHYLPVTQGGPPIPLTPRKRRFAPDTNTSPLSVDKSNKKTRRVTYTSRRTPDEKLEVILGQLKDLHWTLGKFMYYLFRLDDEKGQRIHRKPQHAACVHQFLKGNTEPGIGFVLDAWMQSPNGVLSDNSPDCDLMFNTSVPYSEIKAVRPALTSFAAQSVKKKLVREAEDAVQPGSGLHTAKSVWSDIGTSTAESVVTTIKKLQPLTWDIVTELCARPPQRRNGVTVVRKNQPVDGVSSYLIDL